MNYKNIIFKSSFLIIILVSLFLVSDSASASYTCTCKKPIDGKPNVATTVTFTPNCGVNNSQCMAHCGDDNVASCVEKVTTTNINAPAATKLSVQFNYNRLQSKRR